MIKSKKSAIEVQFNWLFVLVIGAIILIVFFGFTFKQRKISEDITQSSIVNALDAITKSAQSSVGEVSIVPVAKEEVGIECNRISLGGASKQYENLILFSPKKLETRRLITHTMSLNIPYRVSNLLFVTSPDVKYIIIGDFNGDPGKTARFINQSIPKEINKEVYYVTKPVKADGTARDPADKLYSAIANQNDKKVRVVIIGSTTPLNWNSIQARFTSLKEHYSELIIKSDGDLTFAQYENNALATKSSKFIGESDVGAVYSDDIEQYNCNMNNLFKNIKKVSGIYKEKAAKLKSDSSTGTQCDTEYENFLTALNGIITNPDFKFPDDIARINNAITTLKASNDKLQKASCPSIY